MVCAPRPNAPRPAASITPPHPPQMSVAPCAPISAPTLCASSSTSTLAPSPPPITAIAGRRSIAGSHAQQRGKFRDVGDHEIGLGDILGQRRAAPVHPRHAHRGLLRAEHIFARRVADEQDGMRLYVEHRPDALIDERIWLAEG